MDLHLSAACLTVSGTCFRFALTPFRLSKTTTGSPDGEVDPESPLPPNSIMGVLSPEAWLIVFTV